MVLWCSLKLSTRCTGSGASWEVQTKVCHRLDLPRATRHELQNDLQMVTTCAGLGGQAVNSDQLLLVPGLGTLTKRYGAH